MKRTVLLVEDSPGDVRLTQEAFRDDGASIDFHVDGVAAMSFLQREGNNAKAIPAADIPALLKLPPYAAATIRKTSRA